MPTARTRQPAAAAGLHGGVAHAAGTGRGAAHHRAHAGQGCRQLAAPRDLQVWVLGLCMEVMKLARVRMKPASCGCCCSAPAGRSAVHAETDLMPCNRRTPDNRQFAISLPKDECGVTWRQLFRGDSDGVRCLQPMHTITGAFWHCKPSKLSHGFTCQTPGRTEEHVGTAFRSLICIRWEQLVETVHQRLLMDVHYIWSQRRMTM